MKKFAKENKGLLIKAGVSLLLLIYIFVLMGLKSNVKISEEYSKTFGRFMFTTLGVISMLFPISLTEIFAVSSVIILIVLIVLIIKDLRKKSFLKAINKATTIIVAFATFFACFYSTMQLQYNRAPVPIPLHEGEFNKNEFYDIVKHFEDDYIDCASKLKFKESGDVISPYSLQNINELLKKEYKRLDDPKFNNYFAPFSTNVKPMMSSAIYSELQITGLTFGALGEANINTCAPMAGIPMTMAHEMAHVKGVMRENDANLVAIYLLLTSEDYFLRFSGYFWSFYRLFDLVYYTDDPNNYLELESKIPYEIRKNDYYNYKYWKDHDLLGKIGDFFNNLYLKSSGTSEGTDSYNDTETEVNEEEQVITLSVWQRIYLGIYYS